MNNSEMRDRIIKAAEGADLAFTENDLTVLDLIINNVEKIKNSAPLIKKNCGSDAEKISLITGWEHEFTAEDVPYVSNHFEELLAGDERLYKFKIERSNVASERAVYEVAGSRKNVLDSISDYYGIRKKIDSEHKTKRYSGHIHFSLRNETSNMNYQAPVIHNNIGYGVLHVTENLLPLLSSKRQLNGVDLKGETAIIFPSMDDDKTSYVRVCDIGNDNIHLELRRTMPGSDKKESQFVDPFLFSMYAVTEGVLYGLENNIITGINYNHDEYRPNYNQSVDRLIENNSLKERLPHDLYDKMKANLLKLYDPPTVVASGIDLKTAFKDSETHLVGLS